LDAAVVSDDDEEEPESEDEPEPQPAIASTAIRDPITIKIRIPAS
jgi:hypothetical protein